MNTFPLEILFLDILISALFVLQDLVELTFPSTLNKIFEQKR